MSAAATMTRHLAHVAGNRYRPAGRFAYHFARNKLKNDPVFETMLSKGLFAHRARILDLGCGQGLLAAWLLAAGAHRGPLPWPRQWAPPPQPAAFRGIERTPRSVERARIALGRDAEFLEGDVRRADFGRADCIVILDVLQYIEYTDQRGILERVHAALPENGVLLLRIGDARGGIGFRLTTWVDRMVLLGSGGGLQRFYCRATAEWRDLLTGIGFDSDVLPMSMGTPFANMLIIARRR